MAFQLSKSSHNSRTKHYFANPRIKIQENMTKPIETLTCTSLMLQLLKDQRSASTAGTSPYNNNILLQCEKIGQKAPKQNTNLAKTVHVNDVVTDCSYALTKSLVSTLFGTFSVQSYSNVSHCKMFFISIIIAFACMLCI